MLTDGDKCIRTSTYYAYELMTRHRGATAVRMETASDGPLGLSVSASRRDADVHLTLVNPRHDTGMTVACALSGVSPSSAKAVLLHHADWNACNTFEAPDAIVPKDHAVEVTRGGISVVMPPLSIVSVSVRV